MEDEISFLKNIINWNTVDINKLTLDEISKYDEYINFDNVSDRNDLNSEFIRKYKDKLNFKKLSYNFKFTEEELNEYFNLLDLLTICKTHTLSNDFMSKYNENLNWDMISKYQTLDDEIINRYQYLVNWDIVVKYQELDTEQLEKYKDHINLNIVCKYQTLDNDYMINNIKKLDFEIIREYQILDEEMLEQYYTSFWSLFRYKIADLIGYEAMWIYKCLDDKITDLKNFYMVEKDDEMEVSISEDTFRTIDNDDDEDESDKSEIELEEGISALKDKSLENNDDKNTEEQSNEEMNIDIEENTKSPEYIYCYKAIDCDGIHTYFDNYNLNKKVAIGNKHYTTCNFNQEKVNFITDTNLETDQEKVVEIDDDFSYITELGYCCWTKKEVQLDMRYYYPNTHYKLAKVKVYVDDLVLLDNNDESSNGRYGEIRCSYFEIIEIFDAIELISPRECATPENTD